MDQDYEEDIAILSLNFILLHFSSLINFITIFPILYLPLRFEFLVVNFTLHNICWGYYVT